MKRLLAVVLVIGLLMALLPSALSAAKPAGEQDRLNQALNLAASLHLDRQGTYSGIPYSWEWQIGTGIGATNVIGITATGLLAAYEKLGNAEYLTGAQNTGDTLISLYDAAGAGRPYSQDVEFLVRLSSDSAIPLYADKAAEYYQRVMTAFTAEQNADRYINARYSLAGWDLASQIRAALSVGANDYAAGIAARLIERRADWEGQLYGGYDYTTGSFCSLLWAFVELDQNNFCDYREELRVFVHENQSIDGSWDSGDYQSTAYALISLAADGTARGIQAKGWGYLRDSMTAEGGWSYPPEIGEVNSEVIMALGSLDLKGLKAGHVDPNPEHGKDAGKHRFDPLP